MHVFRKDIALRKHQNSGMFNSFDCDIDTRRLRYHRMNIRRQLAFGSLLVLALNVQISLSQTRTLEDFAQAAQRYSATLIDYQNQLTSLGYDSAKIRSTFLPKIHFTSQAIFAPVIGGFGYDSALSNGGVYSALISASQDLFQGGNRDLQISKLGVQRQSVSSTLVINQRDLLKTITSQYITTYTDLTSIHYAEENLKLIDEQVLIVRDLVNKAVYSQLDYLNILIAQNQQKITQLQARAQYRTDLYRLNQLSGISDTDYVVLTEPQIRPTPTLPWARTLRAQQFAFDSLSIEYDRSLLDWNYKPKLGWFADAGLNTTNLRNVYHNLGFSVGLNFVIPIYDGGIRDFENEKFDLAINTISAKSHALEVELHTGKSLLEAQLRSQDQLLEEYQKQIESIKDLLQYQELQLRQGTVKITDLLLTLGSLNATRSGMRQAEIARLQSITELNYLNQ